MNFIYTFLHASWSSFFLISSPPLYCLWGGVNAFAYLTPFASAQHTHSFYMNSGVLLQQLFENYSKQPSQICPTHETNCRLETVVSSVRMLTTSVCSWISNTVHPKAEETEQRILGNDLFQFDGSRKGREKKKQRWKWQNEKKKNDTKECQSCGCSLDCSRINFLYEGKVKHSFSRSGSL